MLFSEQTNFAIGLDISDKSLKAVQLKKKGDKCEIHAIGRRELPKGTVENGELKNSAEFAKALSALISDPTYGHFTGEEMIFSVPENKSFLKYIAVKKGVGDIVSTIKEEIEKQIPLSIADLVYDWQIIEESPSETSVLVGAVPGATLDNFKHAIEQLKFNITAIEMEPIAISRCALAEENGRYKGIRDKNYLIIDIGAKKTCLVCYSKNTIIFTVSLPISGDKITSSISEKLEIEYEQAEKAKIVCGLDETKAQGIIKTLLSEMIDMLVSKIKESITYYNEHFSSRGPIHAIYLTGGGANIVGLDKVISDNTLISARISNPMLHISDIPQISSILEAQNRLTIPNSQRISKIQIEGTASQNSMLSYSAALGLALRPVFIKD